MCLVGYKKVLLVLLSLLFTLYLGAQEHSPENDHVKVTLTNGTVVEGYVQKYWVDGKLFKRMNTSFTMSAEPDGKDAKQYNAETVSAIDFVTKSTADGRYDHLESQVVANPSTFSPKKTRRQFVYKEADSRYGTLYWWNGVDQQNMQLGKMNISTIYGVQLEGDSVVVPFMTGNVISLNAMRIRYKKSHPGLVDYVDSRVLKGGKTLWTAIANEPILFMKICGDYLDKVRNEKVSTAD